MSGSRRIFVPALLALAAVAGCVSFGKSDPARLYLLTSEVEGALEEDVGLTVGLLPVEIPKSVRRPHLVYTVGENEVELASFARWAEPLQDGLARVLAENTSVLLPGRRVESFPFPPGVPIDVRVSIHVTDFVLDPRVPEARLGARWSTYGLQGETPVHEGSWSSSAAAADTTAAALVRAMSGLLAGLTQEAVKRTPLPGTVSP